jgi:hypothetical protein
MGIKSDNKIKLGRIILATYQKFPSSTLNYPLVYFGRFLLVGSVIFPEISEFTSRCLILSVN